MKLSLKRRRTASDCLIPNIEYMGNSDYTDLIDNLEAG